ncbi:hypothetical protein TNCT_121981 [Trichonephila clavata]|uniref:Uncharacterized protein n=1 Tax=Trichonephila clavata TaxID=2740835 RepID=A0A8X6JL07_TRICU|nr:hypothetical protein TNCT_121981 [Trichonephila clavata]
MSQYEHAGQMLSSKPDSSVRSYSQFPSTPRPTTARSTRCYCATAGVKQQYGMGEKVCSPSGNEYRTRLFGDFRTSNDVQHGNGERIFFRKKKSFTTFPSSRVLLRLI